MRETTPNKKLEIDENEPLKLWLIPELYGWLIILMGVVIFLMLVPTALGSFYYQGLSVETLFEAVMLIVEGVGIGGGFVAFGVALRRIIMVQATLCVIFLLITIWFVWFFSMYGEWSDVWEIVAISVGVTTPLALCIFVNRDKFDN